MQAGLARSDCGRPKKLSARVESSLAWLRAPLCCCGDGFVYQVSKSRCDVWLTVEREPSIGLTFALVLGVSTRMGKPTDRVYCMLES
jgi:hypothetical protein